MAVALERRVSHEKGQSTTGDHGPLKGRTQLLVVLSITLLAGILRLYRLGEWSFWVDETYTLRDAANVAIKSTYPIWYLITHVSISTLGITEWGARLPAAVVGTLAVPLTFLLVRRVCGALTGIIVALMMALSPWHLYWSQNARFYILLSLLASLALLVFYLGMEEDRLSYLVASMVLFGLAMLTHTTALLAIGTAGVYVLLLGVMRESRPRGFNRRNLAILAALAAVALLFVAWRILGKPTDWTQFLEWVNNDPLWLASVLVYYLSAPIVGMAAVTAVYLLRRRDRLALLLTLAAVIPPAAILSVSTVTYSASRYMFVAAVPWFILAARGAAEILRNLRFNARWLGVGIIVLLLAEGLAEDLLYFRYQNGNRFDYREAYQVVQERMQPGDRVLANKPELATYYLPGVRVLGDSHVDLAALVRDGQRAWFVSDLCPDELEDRTADWLRQNTMLIANLDVHARARNFVTRVYLFDPAKQYQGGNAAGLAYVERPSCR